MKRSGFVSTVRVALAKSRSALLLVAYPYNELLSSMDDFLKTLRTGVRPNGEPLKPPMADMTTSANKMSDVELKAMFAFFKSLPPLPDGK